MLTLTINGTIVPQSEISGLNGENGLRISQQKSDKGIERKITSDLVITGETFESIKQQFYLSPLGLTLVLPVVITDDCCGEKFKGIITFDGMKYCDNLCEITMTVVEDTIDFTCFQSTQIAKNVPTASFPQGFQQYPNHPKMLYCVEMRPNFLQDVVIILSILMSVLLILMVPLVTVVQALIDVVCAIISIINDIIDAINVIPGINIGKIGTGFCDEFGGTQLLTDFTDLISSLQVWVIGCGHVHPSPLIRDYIKNVCEICGITFESQILNNPNNEYYNSIYFYAPVKKGTPENNPVPFIGDNEPLLTLDMLFDKIKPLFAADYVLTNGVLKFDRRDKLSNNNIAFDFTAKDKSKLLGGVCYSWNGDGKPAFDNITYAKDAIDFVGNESADRYNDIIDYNVPYNKAFKGERDITFEFGACRHRDDGIERDVLSAYKNFPFVSSAIANHNNVIIMAQQYCSNPKILIWDGELKAGRVKRYNIPAGYIDAYKDSNEATPVQLYNYPFFVDADFNSLQANLWEYLQLDDPRSGQIKHIAYELSFEYECGDVSKLDLFNAVTVELGRGTIDSWEIDFFNKTAKLTGTI